MVDASIHQVLSELVVAKLRSIIGMNYQDIITGF